MKSTQAVGCYCHCSKGKGLGSCVKMCEMPKYASRWWATSCTKSRSRYSGDNPGAGPVYHIDCNFVQRIMIYIHQINLNFFYPCLPSQTNTLPPYLYLRSPIQ